MNNQVLQAALALAVAGASGVFLMAYKSPAGYMRIFDAVRGSITQLACLLGPFAAGVWWLKLSTQPAPIKAKVGEVIDFSCAGLAQQVVWPDIAWVTAAAALAVGLKVIGEAAHLVAKSMHGVTDTSNTDKTKP